MAPEPRSPPSPREKKDGKDRVVGAAGGEVTGWGAGADAVVVAGGGAGADAVVTGDGAGTDDVVFVVGVVVVGVVGVVVVAADCVVAGDAGAGAWKEGRAEEAGLVQPSCALELCPGDAS